MPGSARFALFVLPLALASSLACNPEAPAPHQAKAKAKAQTASDTTQAPMPEAPLDRLAGSWHAELTSPGGALGFGLEISARNGGYDAQIKNGPERLSVTEVAFEDDTLRLRFDGYDSQIHASVTASGTMSGTWTKTAPGGNSSLPFLAVRAPSARLGCATTGKPAPASIAGAWDLNFAEEDGSTYVGRAEFTHEAGDPVLRGTVMTDTGDYRYLEGCYVAGSLGLSVFDGAHAFLFRAEVELPRPGAGPDQATLHGDFWSRDSYHATFTGTRLEAGAVDRLADPWAALALNNDTDQFRFEFPDLEGKLVSNTDPRFAAKVVIIDIFGTWCPNCNDQAPVLARWAERYADRGLEVVGLAYEFTGEVERDTEYIGKYVTRHGLERATMLLAGTSDKDDAAATLPDLDTVRSYPTTLFIGRDAKVRKIYSGFFGPATGQRHAEMLREHEALIESLLAEPAPG